MTTLPPGKFPFRKTEAIAEAVRIMAEEHTTATEAARRTGLHPRTVSAHAKAHGVMSRRLSPRFASVDQRDREIAEYATENKAVLPRELAEQFGVSEKIARTACARQGTGIDFRARRQMRELGITCEEEYAAMTALDADMKAEAELNRGGLTSHRWQFSPHRTFEELAEMLRCPPHQVRIEHDRAIVKLRRALASQYRFEGDTPNRNHDHLYASMD